MIQAKQLMTRQRIVREEIDTAIDLLFTGGSLACSNLMAWAAIDVLRGVAKPLGIVTLGDALLEHIKEHRSKEWINALKEHYNYAKHSDRDPDKELEYNPDMVEMACFEATADYHSVYRVMTLPMVLLRVYIFAKIPDIANEMGEVDVILGQRLFGASPDVARVRQVYAVYRSNRSAVEAAVSPEQANWIEIP